MWIIFSILLAFLIIFVIISLIHKYKLCIAHDTQIKNNIATAQYYLSKIENTNSLEELYCIFREITKSLDVSFILNPYGMFRAKSLENCRTTDIYLGDINGLWTFTLNEWMESEDVEAKKIVTNQFRETLINTLNTYIKNEKSK
jgi:hypothetical protein